MGNIISTVLLIPLVIWSVLQPLILHNYSQTKETISIALYEVTKEASLMGHFDENLYAEFKDQLARLHGYNPSCIEIRGTETIVSRGEDLHVTVTIPTPPQSVWDLVSVASCDRPDSYKPFEMSKVIKSEYLP